MTTNQNPYAMQDSLHYADELAALAHEQEVEFFDEFFPGWETAEQDPEDRRFIDYSDVEDPEAGFVRGYGGDHRVYFPGASGE